VGIRRRKRRREMAKTKIHTRYKLKDGTLVPGVTTILQVLAKPALIHWAWDLGCKGIDYKKFRDDKAEIGTLAHYLVMCHFKNIEPDTSDYSAKQIDQAENCLLSFYEWEKGHEIEPILVEDPLVSEVDKYGGTLDLFAKIDGVDTLLDIKTGKGIYEEYIYQLAAYFHLLQVNKHNPERANILRIGRDENEGFECKTYNKSNLAIQWKIFKHCLTIHKLKKEVK
jgi:hypothetical protein